MPNVVDTSSISSPSNLNNAALLAHLPSLKSSLSHSALVLSVELRRRLSLSLFDAQTNFIAESILKNDSSNYNAWFCKKQHLLNHPQTINHLREMAFANECLGDKAKSFQVWQQKRFLLQLRNMQGVEEEMEASREVIQQIDHKNYHAWSFRTWLVAKEELWKQQIAFAQEMIEDDTFNNSAWTYRWFLVGKEAEREGQTERKQIACREVAFTLGNITKEKANRASWNYLRGLFPSISLKDIPCKNSQRSPLIASYSEFPEIEKACQQWWQQLKQRPQQGGQASPTKAGREREKQAQAKMVAIEREVLCTLVHIYADKEETRHFAVTLCGELAEIEKQRGFYWRWVQSHLN